MLVNWLKWLERSDYGVYVACPDKGWLGQQLQALPRRKVLNARFLIPTAKTALTAFLTVLRMCMFILRNRIDVVHCNSDKAYYMACLAAKLTRRPIVTHLRFHYTTQYYRWMFGKWRKPSMIVMVSDAFRQEDEEKLSHAAPGVPLRVLHNCIDAEDYEVICLKQNQASNQVFYPAAIAERKRQHQLYAIDKILKTKGDQCEFTAAGKVNEPGYWERCKEEALSNPDNNVRFVGHMNDVTDGYRNAFLSVSLSVYETFGYSVLESMAMGVPVVGYKVDAVEEVLGTADNLVAQDDVKGLADKISALRNDRASWMQVSKEVRQRVTEHFTPDRICRSLVALYQEVLD